LDDGGGELFTLSLSHTHTHTHTHTRTHIVLCVVLIVNLIAVLECISHWDTLQYWNVSHTGIHCSTGTYLTLGIITDALN